MGERQLLWEGLLMDDIEIILNDIKTLTEKLEALTLKLASYLANM